MSKKTKKRLVTTVACSIPAVIAVPSLLTLTQCGSNGSSGTETKHISLSGKTKKEEAVPVFEDKVTYEFLLNDVKNPETIQVSLPNLYVNDTEIENTKKLGMYVANCAANGVVTIIFDTNKLRSATTNELNDSKVDTNVRFDVELKNDQIDETVTGFNLNLTIPEYSVTKTAEHCTINGDNVCYYNTDYIATIVPDEHYYIKDKDSITVTIDGETAAFEWASNVLTIKGSNIKGNLEITVKATARSYKVTHDSDWDNAISGLPTSATYGVDVDADISWEPAIESGRYVTLTNRKVYVTPEGASDPVDITSQCVFTVLHVHIPGELVTGPITLAGEMALWNINIYTEQQTTEGIDEFKITPLIGDTNNDSIVTKYEQNILKPIKGSYKIHEGYAIDEYHVYIGGSERIELDKSKYTFKDGVISIPAIYAYDDVYITLSAVKITYKTTTTGDTHLKFAESEITTDWGNPVDAMLTLDTGYELDSYKVTKIFPTGITQPVTPVLLYQTGKESKPEWVNGIRIPDSYLRDTFKDSSFTIVASSKACERTVQKNLTKCTFDGAGTATIDKEYSGTFKPNDNYELKTENLTIGVGTKTLETAKYYDQATGKLTIPAGVIDQGPVVITAVATAIERKVEWSVKNCIFTGASKADIEHNYECKINANAYYDVDQKPTVTIGGNPYTVADENWVITGGVKEAGEGTLTIPAADITGDIKITYEAKATSRSITYNIDEDYITIDGPETASIEKDLIATFTPITGYEFTGDPTVTIGGVVSSHYTFDNDPTSQTYGKFTIPKDFITGNIQIDLTATPIIRTVTKTLSHCTFTGGDTATIADNYTGTFTVETGYEFPEAPIVTIGGVKTSNYKFNPTSGEFTIPKKYITGDITITMICPVIVQKVEATTSHCTWSGEEEATIENDYTCTFTPHTGYQFTADPTITIGGTTATSEMYRFNKVTGELTILKDYILGKIEIAATATVITRTITTHLTNCTYEGTLPSPTIESDVDITFKLNDVGHEFKTDPIVLVGGERTENFTFNKTTGAFHMNAAQVLGDIDITLSAAVITRDVAARTSNCTWSGEEEATIENDYTCTFTPATGYSYETDYKPIVYVGWDKLDQGDYSFDVATGKLTIPAAEIVDDIGIYCAATATERTVGHTVAFANYSGADTATIEEDYVDTITARDYYEITGKPTIYVGQETQTYPDSWFVIAADKKSGTLTIPKEYILNNFSIDYSATLIQRTVTGKITNGDLTSTEQAKYGTDYHCKITPNDHYKVLQDTKPTVTIDGSSYTVPDENWTVTDNVGTLTIAGASITGNIVVTYEATPETYTVTLDGGDHSTCTSPTTIEYNKDYTWTFTIDDGWMGIGSPDPVVMQGETKIEVPSSQISKTYNKCSITLKAGQVTGNISITYGPVHYPYSVSYNLSHCGGNPEKVAYIDEEYTAELDAYTGYRFESDCCTIKTSDGDPFTDFTFTPADGKITIPEGKVKNNLVITVAAKINEYTVTPACTNCSKTSGEDVATIKGYTAVFTPTAGYEFTTDPTVTFDGEEFDNFTFDRTTGRLTIAEDKIYGDHGDELKITLAATPITKNVTFAGNTDGYTSDGAEKAPIISDYDCNITAKPGYDLPDTITVTVGGSLIAATEYEYETTSTTTATLSIPAAKITGDIVVTVEPTAHTQSVTYYGDNVTYDDTNPGTASVLNDLEIKVAANQGYVLPDTISVTVGDQALTAAEYTYNKAAGTLTIPKAKLINTIVITINAVSE